TGRLDLNLHHLDGLDLRA
ncbi:hypothetical protein ACZ87_02259, partial [Candidatus Erwinia dacicola]